MVDGRVDLRLLGALAGAFGRTSYLTGLTGLGSGGEGREGDLEVGIEGVVAWRCSCALAVGKRRSCSWAAAGACERLRTQRRSLLLVLKAWWKA